MPAELLQRVVNLGEEDFDLALKFALMVAEAIRAAVIFLTRVPVGGFPYSRAEWAWASAQFPLVGGLVGALPHRPRRQVVADTDSE